jgi:CubicO group peptidase (beta-lactamase class C family)
MNAKKLLFPLLFGAGLALALRRIAGPASAKAASNRGPYAAIDAFVEAQMRRLNIPGVSLAVVEGDQIAHLRGFGRARPGGETPSPQTPFVLGSTTKSFTALAVMQLVEAGKVALDAPVGRYLPWFREAPPRGSAAPLADAELTVRHLLNQTSGLSTACGWIPLADFDDRPDAAERQARALASPRRTRPAGAAFEYSNMNYNLLGLIVEAASGETYEAYINNHIFLPLEMRHSYTVQAEAKRDGLAVGHRYWFWSPVAAPDLPLPRGSLASGQLISSAEDMAHYLIAHLNAGRWGGAQLLSPAGVAELLRPAVQAYSIGSTTGQYGMGWYTELHGGTRIVWHSGTVPDFASYMALLPEQKKGVILLVNADHFMMNPVVTEIGVGVVTLLAGLQPSPGPFGFRLAGAVPWVMRALLLVPLLQIAGVAATLARVRRWRQDPRRRPGPARLWGLHVLLPLLPNLALAAVPVYLLGNKLRGFIRLFLPDGYWVGLICGGFAGVWAFLRSVLILRSPRPSPRSRRSSPQPKPG